MDIRKFSSNLTIACFLLLSTIINQALSARTLGNPPPPIHHHHHPITFYMPNVLSQTPPSYRPLPPQVNSQLPFSKPLGLFPPNGGILIPLPNSIPVTGSSTQALEFPGIGIPLPARATLQELELGTVTVIDEDLFEGSVFGSVLVGRAKGMYVVASSEDGNGHMMAMTASFINGEFKDGMRFFGVHRNEDSESHIAVIGGTGKYDGANGYATVKVINGSSHTMGEEYGAAANKFLLFNVYLG